MSENNTAEDATAAASTNAVTPLFVEIRPTVTTTEKYTEAVIVSPVLPQNCRALILRLNESLPDHHHEALAHLKRVRTHNKIISILLYPKHAEGISGRDQFEGSAALSFLEQLRTENYQISSVSVPARLAETVAEWREFNAVWPTKYVLTAPPPIDMNEQRLMRLGLRLAQTHGGVVIVDPNQQLMHNNKNNKEGRGDTDDDDNDELRIITTASREAKEQGYPDYPLATNVLLAIQGVSRLEREAMIRRDRTSVDRSGDDMSRPSHPPKMDYQQYLCTNYDVYCVHEPSVYEAMALLHSRIRRLIFAQARMADVDDVDEKNDAGITRHMVHALQHTNHRYRAFQLIHDKNPHCDNDDDDVSKRLETELR